MESGALTTVDLIILAIMLASGMLAMMRGFAMEVLSIGAFVVAAFAAFIFLPAVRPLGSAVLPEGWTGDAALVVGLFAGALAPLWLISHRLAGFVQGSAIGAIDRSLGFVFGIARVLIVFGIIHLAFARFGGDISDVPWFERAKLRPLIETTGALFAAFIPVDQAIASETEKGYTPKEAEDLDRLIEKSTEDRTQ